jgi:membrane protein insertase Oxa1/YidC/SpoIIIJ
MVLDTTNFARTQTMHQMENPQPELERIFSQISLNPFKIYNHFYNFTTEFVTYCSDNLNMGWIGGIIIGTCIIRSICLPLQLKNNITQQKMQLLGPEMKDFGDRMKIYQKEGKQKEVQKISQEQRNLFARFKISSKNFI